MNETHTESGPGAFQNFPGVEWGPMTLGRVFLKVFVGGKEGRSLSICKVMAGKDSIKNPVVSPSIKIVWVSLGA